MFVRFLCFAGLLAFVAVAALTEDKRSASAHSEVLGSGDSLADLISGTYARPEEKRGKAKVQLAAARKPAKRAGKDCGKDGSGCMSQRPKQRDLQAGYRTLCVRLCDGYYYPISAAAQPGEFGRDEATCRASCSSPAKLFVYKNKDGAPETMTGLDGMPYEQLATAFQYRVSYDSACTCSASPWTEASAHRHRLYALEEGAAHENSSERIEREWLASAVSEEEKRTRARTGADLVAMSAAGARASLDMAQGVTRKAAAVRTPVIRPSREKEARRAVAMRTTPSMTRALRSGATLATPRKARVAGRSAPLRLSENRVVLVQR